MESQQSKKIKSSQVVSESGGRLNSYPNEPLVEIVPPEESWGFHKKAEKTNGRIAMVSFLSLILIEEFLNGGTVMDEIVNLIDKII
tara:strand:- start:6567 stop:6824 length:258 start_codon:yes stop_codon:yes gene_type:complete